MPEMQMSYIVVAATGEQSDYAERPVVTYSNAEAANLHAQRAYEWAKENGWSGYAHGRENYDNPYDAPDACVDYTGVSYHVQAVPARRTRVRPLKRDA